MSKSESIHTSQLFVRVFNQILSREEQGFKELGFKGITLREVHVLEAVFELLKSDDNRMSEIAKFLSITPGSLTTAVNCLVKKGYLVRENKPDDRRVVMIMPTEKAKEVYTAHSRFREKMIAEIIEHADCGDNGLIYNLLKNLNLYFNKNQNVRG